MAERTTEANVSSHRRLVLRALVPALQSVFNGSYDRDPQFANLKITPDYPFAEVDYPCIVVEYSPSKVSNAGVGHEEWFTDANNVMRKWNHNRFEGTINFEIYALSSLDRDILADAVTEVVRFGYLDSQLQQFFNTIYGDPNDPNVELLFSQVMLNSDELGQGGNSVGLAPWSKEDRMIYSTSCSTDIHGGYYNVVPTETWGYITKISASPWEQEVDLTIPFDNPETLWTNPFVWEDSGAVTSKSVIAGVEYQTPMYDADVVVGHAVVSGITYRESFDAATVIGVAVISETETAQYFDGATVISVAVVSAADEAHTFNLTTTGSE